MYVCMYACMYVRMGLCMYVRRSARKEREREENFSPTELQKNQITSTVDDVGLQEAPPIVIMSEARVYKYSLQTNERALCPLPELLPLHFSVLSSESLQHPLQQQQHRLIYPAISADEGNDTQLLISRARGIEDESSTLECAWPKADSTTVLPCMAYVASYVGEA